MITYPLNNIHYSAEDAELFHCTRTSGVFSADDEFAASVTGADNTVTIGPGIAWIRNARFSGKVTANKTFISLDMGLADGSYPRIDAIAIQFDANANQTAIVVKRGVAASSPVPPEVVKTEALYELHIYHVRRGAGATVVSSADITDIRQDRNYCGVMMDDVTNIDENRFLSKESYDPSGSVEDAGGIAKYVATNAPKTNVINSVTSTSTTDAAAAASVRKAYNLAVEAKNAIPSLSSSVSSTSTSTAANSNAVKQAYDRASDALIAVNSVSSGTIGPLVDNTIGTDELTVKWAKCGRIVNMAFEYKTKQNGYVNFDYGLRELTPLINGISAQCQSWGNLVIVENTAGQTVPIRDTNPYYVTVSESGFGFTGLSSINSDVVTILGSISYISAS